MQELSPEPRTHFTQKGDQAKIVIKEQGGVEAFELLELTEEIQCTHCHYSLFLWWLGSPQQLFTSNPCPTTLLLNCKGPEIRRCTVRSKACMQPHMYHILHHTVSFTAPTLNCLQASHHVSMMRWKGVLPRNSDFWESWPPLTAKFTSDAPQNTTKRVQQLSLKPRMEAKRSPTERKKHQIHCTHCHRDMTFGHLHCTCGRILAFDNQDLVIKDQIQRLVKQQFKLLTTAAFIMIKGKACERELGLSDEQQKWRESQ